MALKVVCVILWIAYFFKIVQCSSILALFSSLSYSDHLVFRGYVSLLAQEGHSLVVMTPYPGHFKFPEVEKIVELDVSEASTPYWEEFKSLHTNTDDYFPRLQAMNEHALKVAIAQLKSKQMTALFINPNVKFDLVVTEADVPLLYAVAEKYHVPHIAITTSSGKIHQYEAKGCPTNPILYPDVNTIYHGNITSWQKISELKRYYQTRSEYTNNYLYLSDMAAKKILGLQRDLQEVEVDIDMLLIASSPLLNGARPTVPAVSYVDRMHIKPGLALPKEAQQVLDAAKKGAIYFCLGAIQESEQLSPKMLETLVEAFRELPFTVLWKIGNVTTIKVPNNVVAHIWFPQQQILAHPNIKAFITHGGPRSLEEAVFYQVPIIGLPIVKSRKVFIKEITKYGAGEILDSYNLDKETVKNVVTDVATNPKYKKAMTILKEIMVDEVLSGPENAMWWTDYILRNRGGQQLAAAGVGVTFASYYNLDLLCYLFIPLLFALLTVLYFVIKILKRILRRMRGLFRNFEDDPNRKFKAL